MALLLRTLWLGTIPNGFYCDEASNGYDSYSILMTMRDRSGDFLPLFVKAFGDYRPSLYVFITIPFIKILGLNEFAIRLPAALIGTLNVVVIYYLVKELFTPKLGLLAALLFAINPWHIQFSRIAFEVILLPFFFALGILFFVTSFKQSNFLILSAIFFGFSLHTYQSARFFVPLFLIMLILIFRNHLWRIKKQTLIASIIFILIFIPLFIFWISPEGMARARQVKINTNLIGLTQSYLSYFSPDYLFFNGDSNLRHSPPGIGELYVYELLTVVLGVFYLLKNGGNPRSILLLWLFLYPLPAALTGETSAVRSLIGSSIFSIISACGITYVIVQLKLRNKLLINTIVFFLLTFSISIFWNYYFVKYPLNSAINWDYGYREAIEYAQKSSYKCVVFSSDTDSQCFAVHGFSVLIPFYIQYPPAQYQLSPIPLSIKESRANTYSLNKYKLMPIFKHNQFNDQCLYILRPHEISTLTEKGYTWNEVHTIKDSNGTEYFKLMEISRKY
ncbi:ArnT family glycosyltransferase [Trichormus variabilis]|nr:glycosyltransferase family 39 protein [Trichormus variabilis]MBD2626542.1 glycosyltransferase family 39 protein [Trichormus variabilis FACHB-164]